MMELYTMRMSPVGDIALDSRLPNSKLGSFSPASDWVCVVTVAHLSVITSNRSGFRFVVRFLRHITMDEEAAGSCHTETKLPVENPYEISRAELQIISKQSFSDDEFENEDDSDFDFESSEEEEDEPEENGDTTSATPDVNWADNPATMKAIDFSKRRELLATLPESNEPLDYFLLLMDKKVLDHIVEQTNSYAVEVLSQSSARERSRISRWKDLENDELLEFIGLILHMGTIRMNRYQDYWRTDRLYNLKCFSDHMSRDRFMIILRCLHFAPIETGADRPVDRLWKIRPLLDYFNDKMKEVYYPGKELCIDEPMALWRGRLVSKQYIQNEFNRYSIKMYTLTEPNGLALKFAIYTGQLENLEAEGHVNEVVFDLMDEKLGNGHSLYTDEYYNSYDLSMTLLENFTYITGILHSDRKSKPQIVTCGKLKNGETKCLYSNDGVMVGKWRDKHNVRYISSEHENEMVEYQSKRGRLRQKPKPIVEYDKYMDGTDRLEQMLEYYPLEHKVMTWYKKLAVHVFQMMLLNSFHLYNMYSGKKTDLYDYRLALIRGLLRPKRPKRIPARNEEVPAHFPAKITEKKSGRIIRRRCRMCHRNKIRKASIYYCMACPDNPALCVTECFQNYHEQLEKH
ncbi:hypothetical protein JTB14_030055 [Gonioctena quinquepunctata]|nr:hypothetical protein JTB14_030055 [Gonioctena quinquepunctata]